LPNYRIVFFDEIDDPYKVTLIFQLSLSWSVTPSLLQELRSSDERYTREFGIFAVMRDGTVAGGLLFMRFSTQTTQGRLEVGGVNAVSTRPDFARRGLMTAIMNRTHEYFRERDLEYSVLTSSRRLGATVMYQQLGYSEIDHSEVAVKCPNQPRTRLPEGALVRPFSEADVDNVDNVYGWAVEGSTGFICRPKNFLKARKYSKGVEIKPAENMRVVEREDSVTGYAYWEPNQSVSEAPEIMALDQVSFHALLADAERRNPDVAVLVWCDGLTDLEIGWLNRAGYQAPLEAYGSFLAKSLKGKTDSNRIRTIYGVDSGRFRIGLWDGT
jgi:GNAT superfamily N-acetyltransferase